jgi:hypothetical protein
MVQLTHFRSIVPNVTWLEDSESEATPITNREYEVIVGISFFAYCYFKKN